MNIIGIIPARFQSTRLPGKPLIDINGKSMIQRVFLQASKSHSLSRVIVATDNTQIFDHVTAFGGDVMMTSGAHNNGTERCGEVARQLSEEFDVVINIQGDEPFIKPAQIDQLAECFNDSKTQIATLIKKIKFSNELFNPSIIKVIKNDQGEAIYFSRAPVPFLRDVPEKEWVQHHTYYKHVCTYGFRADILPEVVKLELTPLEQAESLEQLRWIENGYTIKVGITKLESKSIDTPEDLDKIFKK